MCKWSVLGKKDKHLQWKVQEFVTGCSLKLAGQTALPFSTRGSVQLQAVPARCQCSFQVWTETFPNICQTSQEAAIQLPRGQVWIGPVRAQGEECPRERAPGCSGSLCSLQVREEQPSWAQHLEGIATHWPEVFHYGITSPAKPKGTSFSCSHG